MQSASTNYVIAASGDGGVWASPKLSADWMRDGYDSTGVLLDQFNRNVTDAWGSAESGQAWTNSVGPPSAFDVVFDGGNLDTSGYATHTVLETDDGFFKTRNSVLSGPMEYVADHLVAVQMPVPTGAQVESLTFMRYVDSGNHYRAGVIIFPGGSVQVAGVRAVGAVETGLFGVTTPVTYTNLAVLWYRTQILADGTLRVKTWLDGGSEPDWQATVADGSPIVASGLPGLHTTSYPGNTNTRPLVVRYPYFKVTNLLPDDISNQAQGWSVTHFIDDGYPDSVTYISGVGTPTLEVDLAPPPSYLTDDMPQLPAQYYSPYNTRSPIYGRDRDVSPVKLEHGVITSAGPERITIFTGQMADIPVKSGKAKLSAMSATRLKLAKLVQPPAVNGLYQGANATWPISYALAACKVYPSPPPQTGCRLWAPMHGSSRSFIPASNGDVVDSFVAVDNKLGANRTHRIRTCTGPFVAALENGVNPAYVQRTTYAPTANGLRLDPGDPMISQASVGKFEAWVRGDDVNLNFFPGGSGVGPTTLHRWLAKNNNGSGIDAAITVPLSGRKLVMTLTDGTNQAQAISTNPVPTDGAWHFVGFAWDVANKKVWVNLDGTVNTATNGSIVVSNFPTADDFQSDHPQYLLTLPCAELQVTTGTTGEAVSPDVGPWLRDIAFTPMAVVDKSDLDLANVAEPTATEAWALMSQFAQGELASMRTDELDVFQYLTLGHWVEAAQQVVVETYSTDFNTGTVDINIDPTKIKNEIQVGFSQVLTFDSFSIVVSYNEPLAFPPGITLLTLPTTLSAFEVRGLGFFNISATDTVQPTTINSVSFNGAPDGSGSYFSQAYVIATIIYWDPGQVVIQVDNLSTITMYLANNKNWPSLTVAAKAQDSGSATVIESDDTSIGIRGERALSVTNNALQTRTNARRLARRLLMALRSPQPAAESLTLFGEARRQPGDLVGFADPSITQVSGLWRAQSVGHTFDGSSGEYTNEVIVRPTRDILIIGQGTIGDTLIGPEQ